MLNGVKRRTEIKEDEKDIISSLQERSLSAVMLTVSRLRPGEKSVPSDVDCPPDTSKVVILPAYHRCQVLENRLKPGGGKSVRSERR